MKNRFDEILVLTIPLIIIGITVGGVVLTMVAAYAFIYGF